MADNFGVNPTTSDTPVILRTDDIGSGVQMPVTKIHTGADGVDGGPVTTGNPLPVGVQGAVEIANDAGSPVPVSGTVEVTNDAGNPLPVSGTVDTGLAVGAGAVDADTLRTVTATDDPVVASLGGTTDAGVVTDANGSVSAKLRGLVTILADVWDSANDWLKVSLQASRAHIGQVGGNTKVVVSNLTLDTNAYLAGDTLADIVEVTNAVLESGGTCTLQSVTVIDASDQGAAIDFLFFDRTFTQSSKNAAWNTSDSDMYNCQGIVRVAATDFVDLGSNRIATIRGIGLPLKPNATSLFVGTVIQGAGTYAADGLRVVLTFLQD